ncbi:MAG: hypothetical protein ACK5WZ_14625 [Pseudobdellovibrionaceae bacterium]
MSQLSSKVALVVTIALSVATAFAQTQPTTAPAAGSTTATIPTQAPSVLSKFSASATFEGTSTQNSWRDNGAAGEITSVNLVTGTYKINETQKVSLRQYFAWNRNEVETGKGKAGTENKILPNPLFARFHQATNGILGSEKTELSLWVSLPVGDVPQIRDTGVTILRADYYPNWTVTPNVTLGYFLSPRANLVDRDNQFTDFDRSTKHVSTTFRAVHGPSASYIFNEKNSVYLFPYLDQFFDYNNSLNYTRNNVKKKSSDGRDIPTEVVRGNDLARNDLNIDLGYEFSQKLTSRSTLVINPYLSKTSALDENLGAKNTRWLDADDMTYNLAITLTL